MSDNYESGYRGTRAIRERIREYTEVAGDVVGLLTVLAIRVMLAVSGISFAYGLLTKSLH